MSDTKRASGLETLIFNILHNTECLQDTDRDEIAYIVFHERFGDDFKEAAKIIGLDAGVLSFIAREEDWKDALTLVLSDRRLIIALANELAQSPNDAYCPRHSNLSTAFKKLLNTAKLPIIRSQDNFRGRARQDEFLFRTKKELEDLSNNDKERFKDIADSGWGELEILTKILVGFHQNLFVNSGEITESFINALQATGLNQRFDKMRSIQKKFALRTDDDTDYVHKKERIDCQWHLGRPTPFSGFLTGEIEVNLSEAPSRWNIKWQDKLAKYDNSQQTATGKTLVSLLNYYKTNVDFYRHFYAHSNRQEWTNAGREMVQKSFEASAEIIQRILDLNLCPDRILPIAIGYNGFQQRVAFFIHEKDLKSGTYDRKDIKMMFLREDQIVELHRYYFCPHPAKSGMFEPLLVPADEII